MTVNIAVVIPYFQRESGILRRALQSVAAQDLPADVQLQIIVVDDSSPCPSTSELEELRSTYPKFDVTVLHRINGGPGAARNSALDSLDTQTVDFVAFLDSDDVWQTCHLKYALDALQGGADFYFCNHTRFDSHESWFDQVLSWRSITQADYLTLTKSKKTRNVSGRAMLHGLVMEYLGQTSTVVYRFSKHPDVRFDLTLRNAGEDQLFFMMVCARSTECTYSTESNVYCGQGENIWFGNFGWSAPGAADRYAYVATLYSKVSKTFELNPTVEVYSRKKVARSIELYHYLALRNAMRGQRPDFRLAARLLVSEPLQMAMLPISLARSLLNRKRLIPS